MKTSRFHWLAAFILLAVSNSIADNNLPRVPQPIDKSQLTLAQKKIDSKVLSLAQDMVPQMQSGLMKPSAMSSLSTPLEKFNSKGMIQLYVEFSGDSGRKTINAINKAGGTVDLLSPDMSLVQCWLPLDKIESLAKLSDVRNVRRPGYAMNRAGAVMTEGDALHFSDNVRSIFGFKGSGVKVGVISDGISGYTDSQLSEDLPPSIEAQSARANGSLFIHPSGRLTSEGTAMLEIVHDIAPFASLAFSNAGTSAEFIQAIQILDETFSSDIICDDLGFLDEPFFEDGPIGEKVNSIDAKGKIFVSAAGNSGLNEFYEADYIKMLTNDFHDFSGSGDINLQVTIPPSGAIRVVLQWNDEFGQSGNDYDLYLFDSLSDLLTSSIDTQNGTGNPHERIHYANPSTSFSKDVYIAIHKASGISKRIKLLILGDKSFVEHSNTPGSVWGHPASTGAIAVGAINQDNPTVIASYSSRGPVRIDFPSLESRPKPDISGIDGVSITGNGGFSVPFYGTSAAAPHIAGILAQLWSAKPTMSNTKVKNALFNFATDLGEPGFDNIYGYGLANASAAAASLDIVSPTFSNITATPSQGIQGDNVVISIMTSEDLVDNPVVTINGHTATFSSLLNSTYSFTYTVSFRQACMTSV